MKKIEKTINYFDADFWVFVHFLTKINTNSAKICLLFRRKAIGASKENAVVVSSKSSKETGLPKSPPPKNKKKPVATVFRFEHDLQWLYDEIASNFWAKFELSFLLFRIENIFFLN